MTALKLILKIVIAPVILLLTLAIWICVGLVYVSGLVLGLLSTVIALLGVAVLVTYSPQNGLILLVIAFLISPFGLPELAFGCWARCRIFGIFCKIQFMDRMNALFDKGLKDPIRWSVFSFQKL